MLLFASGKYTGTPEAHLVFINYIYGLFISFLYSVTTKIEWYTLLFAVIHVLSLSLVISSIICKNIKPAYKVLFIVLFYTIELRLILQFQFTTTAALAALGGITLILKEKKQQYILGIILLIISSLIRFEAALLVILMASPAFISYSYKNRQFYLSQKLISIMIAVTLIMFCKYIDHHIYQNNSSWAYYSKYNKMRGQINDNPNANYIKNSLPSGISSLDYQLLLNFMPDPKIINIEHVSLLQDKIGHIDLKQKIKNIYPALRSYTTFLLLIIALWTIIYLCSNTRLKKNILLFSLLLFLSLLCFIALDGTLKYRVFLASLMPFLFVLFFNLEPIKRPLIRTFAYGIGILFFIIFSYRICKIQKQKNYSFYSSFIEQKNVLDKYLNNKNNYIVALPNNFNIENYSPFSVSSSFFCKQIFFSGWLTGIPYNEGLYDSYLDVINKNAIFCSKQNLITFIPLITRAIKNNYKINVYPKIEIQSDHYVILRFCKESY